ncbi:MAG: DUF4190 domain-containing protein [Thermoleophilia bacterium]
MAYPPPPPIGVAIARPSSGRATASLVLGILGLATGVLVVPLLAAVLGNVLGSLAQQDIDASGGRIEGAGRARAGMVCSTVALVLWSVVLLIAVAVRGSGS